MIRLTGGTWRMVPQSATKDYLSDVWGEGPGSDVFVTGKAGLVLRYSRNTHTWSSEQVETTGALETIWGDGAGNMYVAGWFKPIDNLMTRVAIYQFDGVNWQTAKPGSNLWGHHLTGMWGSSASDIWAIGGARKIHFDGKSWTETSFGGSQRLNAIWGFSSKNIIAVGNGGYTFRFDGKWTDGATSTTENLHGIWGSGPKDVFIVGGAGAILHDDGSGLRLMCSGTSEDLWDVWGTGDGEVYAVGDRGTMLKYSAI